MSETLRVFISYARSDCTLIADELLTGLEIAGFEPFLDRHDIAAGEDWEERLGGLIQSADTVVFVISPGAVASQRCAWEVEKATALSKRIIPVVAIEVSEQQTPAGLKRLNYIFFSEGHSFTKGLAQLATALRTDLDWIREHTRLGELAARWRGRNKAEPMLLRGSELEAAKAWLSAWQAPAPAPTDLHRAFIGESEGAETARFSAEHKRLEEIASAQADRERALKRLRLGTLVAGAVVGVLFLATAAGGALLWQTSSQLGAVRASLIERDAALNAVQTELQSVATALEASRSAIASRDTQRQAQAQQLEALRTRLGQSEAALARVERSTPARASSQTSSPPQQTNSPSGSVTVVGESEREGGQVVCRSVRETYTVGGREQTEDARYCRGPNGQWVKQ